MGLLREPLLHFFVLGAVLFGLVALTTDVGPEVAHLLTELCKEVFDGRNESLGDGVQRALGREPRDFSDYCRQAAKSGVWNLPEPVEAAAS